MSVKENQLETPYSVGEKTKLAGIEADAEVNTPLANQAVAEAGVDNSQYMSSLRVSQAIIAQVGIGNAKLVGDSFDNNSGSLLAALTVVRADSLGELQLVDISNQAQVAAIVGLTTEAIANSTPGLVGFQGRLLDVTTAFVIGDLLYLNDLGLLGTDIPEIGTGTFAEGDAVVFVGEIVKNQADGGKKDFLISLQYNQLIL